MRAPDGRTVLVSGPGVDPRGLAKLVGDRLNVWEHSLYGVIVLAPDQEAGLSEVLRRYPPERRLSGERDGRLELGSAAVDVFAASSGEPSVAVSYGDVWVPLTGQPPVGTGVSDGRPPVTAAVGLSAWPPFYPDPVLALGTLAPRAERKLAHPSESALELVSDGRSIWTDDASLLDTQDEDEG